MNMTNCKFTSCKVLDNKRPSDDGWEDRKWPDGDGVTDPTDV